jgi:Zn-dependent peptidase ImmA (M78 family)/transcriptional regulator with XRE-family HTH domain
MPRVNPEILVWARQSAGLSIAEAAKKLALAPDTLTGIESGEREPSRKQLVKFSEKYRRPLLTFYLPKPPIPVDRGEDFRSLPEKSPDSEALLNSLLRNVRARQQLVRAALEETEEDKPLPFVGSARIANGVDALVASMRSILGITVQQFRSQPTVSEAFALLRAAAEKTGVFVLLMGNLGTHHTDIDVRVFRGFSLADNVAPFVVINEKDSRAAWSFTLLHELAHVWLGQTGISGYNSDAATEKFCDEVAARFLLDPAELDQIGAQNLRNAPVLKKEIDEFAAERNLSRKMVAYNLLRTNRISWEVYGQLSNEFDAERVAQKKKDEKEGGPNYFVVRRHRAGAGLVNLVRRMIAAGALSAPKAGTVLGVKPTAVARLVGDRAA